MSRQEDRSRRLARYVAARRADLGLSQEALADQADLNFKTIHTLETGKHWPVARTRDKVEVALGWTPGDIARIADGGYPTTGPLPDDDPDGLIAMAMAGGETDELEDKIRAVIADLPERHRPFVEELYEQLLDSERQRRRLMKKIVALPARNTDTSPDAGTRPDTDTRDAVRGNSS